MIKITIDDKEFEVEDNLNIIQICSQLDIEIPRFCYHEKLKISGNCRMCLVEVEKAPKLLPSCATIASNGMVIHTNSSKVQKARAGVMEFLLINHPLDCPICDQGGECDLQDQAFKYGNCKSKYQESKRAVEEKDFGPLIKTHMTRCIHCMRCVRFMSDIAGTEVLGTIGRGSQTEITKFIGENISSEISGNIVDLCPVGALTSKPYAFTSRSWELQKTESIDVHDAYGSNIRIDSRGSQVMRILPRQNEDINEQWLADKSRFSYDGLRYQRLDTGYLRSGSRMQRISTRESIAKALEILSKFNGREIAVIAGPMIDSESIFLAKEIFTRLGVENFCSNQFNYVFDNSQRSNYLFNTTIKEIEKADICLLIGSNVKHTAPLLNARLRKAINSNITKIYRIGRPTDQNYHINELGDNLKILAEILQGTHDFANMLKRATNPIFIIGDEIYSRKDSLALQSMLLEIATKYNVVREGWNGYNILHNHASIVGALDLGFNTSSMSKISSLTQEGKIKLIYLIGADEFDYPDLQKTKIIYQGHHGDMGAKSADVIIPSAAYTEKYATYANMEGRYQKVYKAVNSPNNVLSDAEIFAHMAYDLKINLSFSSINEITQNLVDKLGKIFSLNQIVNPNTFDIHVNEKATLNKLEPLEKNYYISDVISKNSVTMSKCSEEFIKR